MTDIAIQISPQAKNAYFADYLEVARAELQAVLGLQESAHRKVGNVEFFIASLNEQQQQQALRLSFVQGLYQCQGESLLPLPQIAEYPLHEDFVFGSKYKGKTNEYLTQLLINIGLTELDLPGEQTPKLLDPMCGRGTTLMWALCYGMNAKGIEQDSKVLDELKQSLKKWSKLHRQKHKLLEGYVGDNKKRQNGKFLEFQANERTARVIIGDTIAADQLIKNEKFDLIVSDLPYGVQHFTTSNTRNPLAVIEASLPAWKALLKKQGVVVLAFNSYIPKRKALIEVFEAAGFSAQPFAAQHRMSESIMRDVVVFKPS